MDYADFNRHNREAWIASVARRLEPGTRVLDVGAGECRYRKLFAHCEYKTQDFCQYGGTREGLLSDEWAYGTIDYVSDVLAIPVEAGSFDAILCTEVLEHLPEPIPALAECGRIVRSGGKMFISAPLGYGLHQEPHHYYGGFTPNFYRRFLDDAGFDVVSIQPNGGFFRHFVQETARASFVIQSRRPYRFWHPLHWVLRLGFNKLIPPWFTRLDDELPIEEFTVGYFVEAVRR